VLDQERQIAAVIEVGMGQNDRVDLPGIEGKRRAIAQPQVFEALEQPAVDKDLATAGRDQVFGAGHRPGGAPEREFHHLPSWIRSCGKRVLGSLNRAST
jgi:hypothetical protein